MKKLIATILIAIIASLTACSSHKNYSRDEIKNTLEQIVKDVYAPKSIKQFKESYNNAVNSGLITKDAADSFYVINGSELTEDDLKRSCYLDVLYSNKLENSENKSHYLVKLQLHGAKGEIITADIFFYVADDCDEDNKTVIDKILVANIEVN